LLSGMEISFTAIVIWCSPVGRFLKVLGRVFDA
jgi:hypothetical protein